MTYLIEWFYKPSLLTLESIRNTEELERYIEDTKKKSTQTEALR